MHFAELPILPSTQAAIEAMGFSEATPVQAATIPLLLEGRDVIGQAQTGTGKTAAFGIPLIEAAQKGRRGLVLCPTRELARQVQRELQAIGKGSPVDVIVLIGGAPFGDQVRALQRHANALIVATPGRVVDHLGRGTVDLSTVEMLVLDEADEMLSMGFADELDQIVAALPAERQTILFTATLAAPIEKLAKRAMKDPETVRVSQGAVADIRQGFAYVAGRDRADAVRRIIEAEDPRAALLFARTRARVEELVDLLRPLGAEALHGGMGQPQRDGVMKRFRDGTTRILIATDVAARGLDVEEVEIVLHDEPPADAETYIHRIGRTARAGRKGASIVFIGPGKMHRLSGIRRLAGKLEQYHIPDDSALAALRVDHVMDELETAEPGEAAKDAVAALLEKGLTAEDIALRAVELLLDASIVSDAPAVATITEKVALALKVGQMDSIHPGAIVGVLTNAGGLRADQVGRIDILPRMSVVEVPGEMVEPLMESLARVRLSGRPLLPRVAEDWNFKTASR